MATFFGSNCELSSGLLENVDTGKIIYSIKRSGKSIYRIRRSGKIIYSIRRSEKLYTA